MPGEKSGYNPGKDMGDEFNEDARELTPEEQAAEKERAQKRMDKLNQMFVAKKAEKEIAAADEDENEGAVPDAPKLGEIKENRSKIKLSISSASRAREAKKFSNANRSEGGQETNHNRDIKDILNKFVFGGSFKLRTAQEKGKFSLRVLSGIEGHKDTRVILKTEGTMEEIKDKLENHLNHNYSRKK